jgi:hypothetical protein
MRGSIFFRRGYFCAAEAMQGPNYQPVDRPSGKKNDGTK